MDDQTQQTEQQIQPDTQPADSQITQPVNDTPQAAPVTMPIINNNGTWSVSDSGNLDMFFQTYGRNSLSTLQNTFRYGAVGDGISRSEGFT